MKGVLVWGMNGTVQVNFLLGIDLFFLSSRERERERSTDFDSHFSIERSIKRGCATSLGGCIGKDKVTTHNYVLENRLLNVSASRCLISTRQVFFSSYPLEL